MGLFCRYAEVQSRLGTHKPRILIVVDDRLSRDRAVNLRKILDQLGKIAQLETVRSRDLKETDLLEYLEKCSDELTPRAIFIPWYQYLLWHRVETRLGASRQRECLFFGYFADPIRPHDLEEISIERNRAGLLDWAKLKPSEISTTVQVLLRDHTRSGLKPLVGAKTTIYRERWGDRGAMGFRFDQIGKIQGMELAENSRRIFAARIILTSLWALVYEEGAGRSDLSNAIHKNISNGLFEFAVDPHGIFFRLTTAFRSWTPAELTQEFWPSVVASATPAQLLLRHSDFLRVLLFPESQLAEITIGLLPSAPADAHPNLVHSFWIDTLPSSQWFEKPENGHGEKDPRVIALPSVPTLDHGVIARLEARIETLEELLLKAAGKVRELQLALHEKDSQMQEWKMGGIGQSARLEPPEPEELVQAFAERLASADRELKEASLRLSRLETIGDDPNEIEAIRRKITKIERREQEWLRTLAEALKSHRQRAAG